MLPTRGLQVEVLAKMHRLGVINVVCSSSEVSQRVIGKYTQILSYMEPELLLMLWGAKISSTNGKSWNDTECAKETIR
ncbi:hypothetical protein AAHA92_12380 [Salvia divinorum]|uniref:Uncharacterized protein n=1 Tax=Salvia divinorum TaxID=28513 RepID=A0ABD1HK21_SALDI